MGDAEAAVVFLSFSVALVESAKSDSIGCAESNFGVSIAELWDCEKDCSRRIVRDVDQRARSKVGLSSG